MAAERVHKAAGSQRRPQATETHTDEHSPASVDVEAVAKAAAEAKEKRDAELDDLLDDIDKVLVENAAEFVGGFIQKGGQ